MEIPSNNSCPRYRAIYMSSRSQNAHRVCKLVYVNAGIIIIITIIFIVIIIIIAIFVDCGDVTSSEFRRPRATLCC